MCPNQYKKITKQEPIMKKYELKREKDWEAIEIINRRRRRIREMKNRT